MACVIENHSVDTKKQGPISNIRLVPAYGIVEISYLNVSLL